MKNTPEMDAIDRKQAMTVAAGAAHSLVLALQDANIAADHVLHIVLLDRIKEAAALEQRVRQLRNALT